MQGNLSDCQQSQKNPTGGTALKWKMNFSSDKYKAMHTGKKWQIQAEGTKQRPD